ncbi:MAG: S24 family peptidase [Lachnospiraceae bacterium]|nr:S24 family peptidase [Lachnospiraceae bacterium]
MEESEDNNAANYYKKHATTKEFENIIKKYRDLDPHGKKMVDFTLNEEWERSTAARQPEANPSMHGAPTRLINYYYRLASAGTGQVIFDTPPTKRIEIPNIPEYRKADYAIGVNGNSMEPAFHDGDMLLIEMTDEISRGEVGIFLVDNESYVKKLGDRELISLNPECDNIPLTGDPRCMGRVIGKL